MAYKVAKTLGGYKVVDGNGTSVREFKGKGAKADAEYFALNGSTKSESGSNYWVGNKERGGQRGGRA